MVELRGISKTYPGRKTKANNNINLDLQKGEILCLAGENGAGKTTLMKILCGLETPDEGDIFINGKKETVNSPHTAKRLGIGMVHQHFMLFPEYTAAENIVMGIEPRKWGIFTDTKTIKNNADKIIAEHGFSINSEQKVKDLTLGQMQQVEICRILHRNAQIIILDEPTSILTDREINALFKTLKKLVSGGKSIILITHKLHEITGICDRVAVLSKGEVSGIFNAAETDEQEIARAMMNHISPRIFTDKEINVSGKNPCKSVDNKIPVIEFDNVTVRRRGQERALLEKVSFSVSPGEILGFAGVGGNGLGVIEAVLGGFLFPEQGRVLHNGKDISALNTRKLRREGLAYVPADRLRVGSAKEATIEENMIINRRHEFIKKLFIDKKATSEFSKKLINNYNIEGAKGNDKCAVLSGGNLQKLILARELNCLKDYIVFSEPTWGLDISSSRFVIEEITSLREKGTAVVLISTNLDEILTLANRIIVMYRGKIAGEFDNTKDMSVKEAIGRCMHGV